MRDIIYRVKDKHKKWHYGFYLKEKTIDGNVLSYIDRSDMLYNIDKVEVDPNTIQEYSGFTDKNKTRVLEDNEKNTKYISILQTDLEKMKNQRDRAIEKLMNNMPLSPDGLYEIIRG